MTETSSSPMTQEKRNPEARYQGRTGLLREHRDLRIRPRPIERVRLTMPAREALQRAGAQVEAVEDGTYTVTLGPVVPAVLVVGVFTLVTTIRDPSLIGWLVSGGLLTWWAAWTWTLHRPHSSWSRWD